MFNLLNPYMLWVKLAGAALAFAAVFGSGMWLEGTIKDRTIFKMQRDQANAVVAAQAIAAQHQAEADRITHDADVSNAAAHQKIITVTQHIIQKVPQYVTPQTDARFPLPCGFIRLHDASALGVEPSEISLPANNVDGDKCPVTTSDAGSIIAANYALALGWRADLQTWEKWYADQAAKWPK